jgi:hypothetical protein
MMNGFNSGPILFMCNIENDLYRKMFMMIRRIRDEQNGKAGI